MQIASEHFIFTSFLRKFYRKKSTRYRSEFQTWFIWGHFLIITSTILHKNEDNLFWDFITFLNIYKNPSESDSIKLGSGSTERLSVFVCSDEVFENVFAMKNGAFVAAVFVFPLEADNGKVWAAIPNTLVLGHVFRPNDFLRYDLQHRTVSVKDVDRFFRNDRRRGRRCRLHFAAEINDLDSFCRLRIRNFLSFHC